MNRSDYLWRVRRVRQKSRSQLQNENVSDVLSSTMEGNDEDEDDDDENFDDSLPGAYSVSRELRDESSRRIITTTTETTRSPVDNTDAFTVTGNYPTSVEDNRDMEEPSTSIGFRCEYAQQSPKSMTIYAFCKQRQIRFGVISFFVIMIILSTTLAMYNMLQGKTQDALNPYCTIDRRKMVSCPTGYLEIPSCVVETMQELTRDLLNSNDVNSYPCDVPHFALAAVAIVKVNSSKENPIEDIFQYWTLAVIYFALGGQDWTSDNNWLTGNSVCEEDWFGLSCSRDDNNTIYIDAFEMISNNAVGSFPLEITLLTSLTRLLLTGNTITGTIPTEVGNLQNLSELWIESIPINGTIPSEIGQCQNLEMISLHAVDVSGTIPTEIGNLSTLENLKLSNIFLEGTLPTEMGLLSNLEFLSLSNMRQLRGNLPSQFVNLAQLSGLLIFNSLQNNDINFSSFLSSLPTTLAFLTLIDSRFISSIPESISLFRNLTDLTLIDLSITGTVPSEIGLMTELQKLELSELMMEGDIPSEIGRLTHLTELSGEKSNFAKSLPQEISDLSELKLIYGFD